MAGLENIKIDHGGIRRLMTEPNSPVVRHIRELGRETERKAKILVGKKTGRLARSISMSLDRTNATRTTAVIRASAGHALVHHQGARPHTITARPGGVLAFRVRGRSVVTRSVRHPGSRANPFLLDALRATVK